MKGLTILGFGFDDDVAFDGQILEARSFSIEELSKGKGADSRRPESLECFCILAPCLNENIQCRASVDIHGFQQ